jgi:dTDP-4-dehydrorhamnose 3,5-epimerase
VDTRPTSIPGCVELELPASLDRRGDFVKAYQASAFEAVGLDLPIREIYLSRSARGVVRGLHFQLPPHDIAKLVWCPRGTLFDAVVDLRAGSPAFGAHCVVELSDERHNALFVPKGCAHGFAACSEDAIVAYAVDGEFDADCDAGIRWDSAGIAWPVTDPVLSDRDAGLPRLEDFESPFVFAGEPGAGP